MLSPNWDVRFLNTPRDITFLILFPYWRKSYSYLTLTLGMAIALLMFRGEDTNEEIDSYNTNEFAGGSLVIPSVRAYADDSPGAITGSVKSCAVISNSSSG